MSIRWRQVEFMALDFSAAESGAEIRCAEAYVQNIGDQTDPGQARSKGIGAKRFSSTCIESKPHQRSSTIA